MKKIFQTTDITDITDITDTTGSTATEYAVIAALVSVIAIPIWQFLGNRLNNMFYGAVTNAFSNVSGGV